MKILFARRYFRGSTCSILLLVEPLAVQNFRLNPIKTSQVLFNHYKNIMYCLERIKEITNMNVEDAEEMLEVQVGLKILKLVGQDKRA